MLRRNLLIATPALALGACNTINIDKTLATVAADANLIAGGLKGVLAQLGPLNIPGLDTAILGKAATAIAGIQTVAASLTGVTSTAAAQPLVQKIESYVNVVVSALASLPLPPPISTAIQAAAILLPIIEIAVGLAVPASAAKASPAMDANMARVILSGAATMAP